MVSNGATDVRKYIGFWIGVVEAICEWSLDLESVGSVLRCGREVY